MEIRDFDGTKVTIKGADDVTDDEIRYYIYYIHKYDALEIDVGTNGVVNLYYEGKCSGETSLRKRK